MIPRLHLIVGAKALVRPTLSQEIEEIGGLGTSVAVHLRARDLGGGALLEAARQLRAQENLVLLVNDRIDVALAADAHGAHLAQHSVDASTARALLGSDRLIGASVHGLQESQAPRVTDADFLIVGSMYPTLSHPGRVPEGVTILPDIAGGTTRPCIAIGGISPERVEVLCSRGAYGIAVRSGVWSQTNPAAAVRKYLESLASAYN